MIYFPNRTNVSSDTRERRSEVQRTYFQTIIYANIVGLSRDQNAVDRPGPLIATKSTPFDLKLSVAGYETS